MQIDLYKVLDVYVMDAPEENKMGAAEMKDMITPNENLTVLPDNDSLCPQNGKLYISRKQQRH